MVRCDEAFAVELEKLPHDATNTFIHGFDRLDSGPDDSSMPNHVGIGKVENDQIVIGHARQKFICDFERAHFRF